MGFPSGSAVKISACNAGNTADSDSIPGLGRAGRRAWQPTLVFLPEEFHGQREAWRATVHGVVKSQTRLRTEHARTSASKIDNQ